jgi:dihydropteroate synthase
LIWKTSKRELVIDRPLVMAILNVTPDSFSDGGEAFALDAALRRAERSVAEGADVLDVGGESTRPGSERVDANEEIRRVIPVIESIADRFDVPISIDTSKADVAERAMQAGAEIINDISAFRFDERMPKVAAETEAGLVLMHSRGEFIAMHSQQPVDDILGDVSTGFRQALGNAAASGIHLDRVALDIGIGFGKTPEQNLELLAKLDKLTAQFPDHPMVVGTSRKSFIGKLLDGAPVGTRLSGSLATAAIAIWNGASIVRVHDVKETVDVARVVRALRGQL